MVYDVDGNLVKDEQYNIFCHQTNCKGVMGSGIAKQIRLKYPAVDSRNSDFCKTNPLGKILVVRVGPERFCVNLYGQDDYGRQRDKVYTNYEALQKALDTLADRLNNSSIPDSWKIGFPNRMSCGLGNANWTKIRTMIEGFADKVRQDVYIVHWKENS